MGSKESKSSILIAATTAFSTKGYDASSLRDIADDAGVNHAIIRYYYGTKMDLWVAVFQNLVSQVLELRNTHPFVRDADDLRQEFRNFVRTRVSYFAHHPQILKIYHLELLAASDRYILMEQMIRHSYNQSLIIMGDMQSVGLGKHINLKSLYFLLLSIFGGRFLHPDFLIDVNGVRQDIEDVIDEHTDLVLALALGPESIDR